MILEPHERLSRVAEAYKELQSYEPSILNGNSHSILWNGHHAIGWYGFLIDESAAKAKQEFYTCGRLDEELMPYQNDPEIRSGASSHIYFFDALVGHFHWLDALLTDSQDLINRRAKLKFPELDEYLLKNIEPLAMIDKALGFIVLDKLDEFRSVLLHIEKSKKAKRFAHDLEFMDSFLKGDKGGMVKSIEKVASVKIHRPRQKVDPDVGPWENELLSRSGITYTKLAWMYGYELEIKNPLVSIANELYPIKPLAHYEETYDFSKRKQ